MLHLEDQWARETNEHTDLEPPGRAVPHAALEVARRPAGHRGRLGGRGMTGGTRSGVLPGQALEALAGKNHLNNRRRSRPFAED
jgi:hypothetical protein